MNASAREKGPGCQLCQQRLDGLLLVGLPRLLIKPGKSLRRCAGGAVVGTACDLQSLERRDEQRLGFRKSRLSS